MMEQMSCAITTTLSFFLLLFLLSQRQTVTCGGRRNLPSFMLSIHSFSADLAQHQSWKQFKLEIYGHAGGFNDGSNQTGNKNQWFAPCQLLWPLAQCFFSSSGCIQHCTAHLRYDLSLISHTHKYKHTHYILFLPSAFEMFDCFLHSTTSVVSSVHSVQPVVKPVMSYLSGTVTKDKLLSTKQ